MKTAEIASKLVQWCKEGNNHEAGVLYADDAVSVEPAAPPEMDRESRGLAAIQAKGQWWSDNHEIHSAICVGPWTLDDQFIVGFKYEVTHKPSKQRMTMEEMALYTVKNGRIIREEFFYGGQA